MRGLTGLWLKLRGFVRKERLDRDLEDELQFHLQMRQHENEQSGMTLKEAQLAARRKFGSEAAAKELGREIFGFVSLERFWQDIRHGWRLIMKAPAFSSIAILSLAVGIGGNATLFSVIHALLIQPPPFRSPDEI